MSDELEFEDVEDKIQALVNEERRRQKTVKYHVLRRQMTPPGAPKRRLSWDAIEQIRYLKEEQPEEWTIQHLAEGFSVTPDVVLRVLRSRFVPSVERRAKQDAKAMAGPGPKVLPSGSKRVQDRLKLPGNLPPALLPPGKEAGAVAPAEQGLALRGDGLATLAKRQTPALVQQLGDLSSNVSGTEPTGLDRSTHTDPAEEEEFWDGRVFTEDDLEEFMEIGKPPLAVQVGKEFFDAEGNFLYRL
ncbi:unnamed protein product [Tetraodon nigroviridis]|nr:unnamed protein product [Tetraodon nigroviridis]